MRALKIIFVLILLSVSLNSCSYYEDNTDEGINTIENTQLTGGDEEADDGSK